MLACFLTNLLGLTSYHKFWMNTHLNFSQRWIFIQLSREWEWRTTVSSSPLQTPRKRQVKGNPEGSYIQGKVEDIDPNTEPDLEWHLSNSGLHNGRPLQIMQWALTTESESVIPKKWIQEALGQAVQENTHCINYLWSHLPPHAISILHLATWQQSHSWTCRIGRYPFTTQE